MRRTLPRPTLFRLLLAVAVVAILLFLVTDRIRSRSRQRRERYLQIAAWHGSLGAEYRRNARGQPSMLHTAAWHDHLRREFERAAADGRVAAPADSSFPPPGWRPPPDEAAPD